MKALFNALNIVYDAEERRASHQAECGLAQYAGFQTISGSIMLARWPALSRSLFRPSYRGSMPTVPAPRKAGGHRWWLGSPFLGRGGPFISAKCRRQVGPVPEGGDLLPYQRSREAHQHAPLRFLLGCPVCPKAGSLAHHGPMQYPT